MAGPIPGSTLGVMKIEDGEENSSASGGEEDTDVNFFDHQAATALRVARKGSMDGVGVEEKVVEEVEEVEESVAGGGGWNVTSFFSGWFHYLKNSGRYN